MSAAIEVNPSSLIRQLKAKARKQHIETAAPRESFTLQEDCAATTEAINCLLSLLRCPSSLRAYVDFIIGLVLQEKKRHGWIVAKDELVGKHARPGKLSPKVPDNSEDATDALLKWAEEEASHPSSRRANATWAARQRKHIIAWQTVINFAVIEVREGNFDKAKQRNAATAYRVPLLDLAAKVVLLARTKSEWIRSPRRAIEQSARELLGDIPQAAAVQRRKPRGEPDARSLLATKRETILTLVAQCGELIERGGAAATGYETPEQFFEQLQPDARGALRKRSLSACLTPENSPDGYTTLCTRLTPENSLDGYTTLCTHPPQENSLIDAPKVEVCRVTVEEKSNPTKSENAAEEQLKRESQPATALPGCVSPSSLAEAVQACDLFDVREFSVSMLNDKKLKGSRPELYEVFSSFDLKLWLPGLLKRNEERHESLTVRPIAHHLIQVDDCDFEMLERLKPFAFMALESSPNNFQAWLALPPEVTKAERDTVRYRLLRALGTADKSASGSTRLPGSLNCKPERKQRDGSFFRVRLVHTAPNKLVPVADLEAVQLLAPEPVVKPAPVTPTKKRVPRSFPDYARCVAEAEPNADGEPDLSIADKDWCILALGRGWSRAETEAKLMEHRDKAKRRPAYARSTVDYAARVVGV